MTKRRITCLVIAVLIALGALVLGSIFFRSEPDGQISLTFTSIVKVRQSSDAPAGKLATFVLSNGTPTEIMYYVESVEHQSNDGWVTNIVRRTPHEWRNFGVTLGPHESRVLLVPPLRLWRLPLGGNKRACGIKGLADRVRDYRDFYDGNCVA
jgi:hypothetical protein